MLQPLMVINASETASRAHAYGEGSSFNKGLLDMSGLFRARSVAAGPRTFALDRESYKILAPGVTPRDIVCAVDHSL
jgi:hypothetical protein